MLPLSILRVTPFCYRCVLAEEFFFDFTISQLDMFGGNSFLKDLCKLHRLPVYTLDGKEIVGDVASIRHVKRDDTLCVLIRNGIRGEFYIKQIT